MLDFDWLIVSPRRRILTTGLTIFSTRVPSGHKNLEPKTLIVMVLFFTLFMCAGPFCPVRIASFILSLATAAFMRRLLVHQTAGEIVDKWIEAAVGAC